AAAAQDPQGWINGLRDFAPNDAERDFITRLVVEPIEFYGELDERFAREVLSTVKTHSINRQETNLTSELSRLDAVTQAEEHNRLVAQLMDLNQQKRALQEEINTHGKRPDDKDDSLFFSDRGPRDRGQDEGRPAVTLPKVNLPFHGHTPAIL